MLRIQGFGVTARSTAEARRLDPTGITTFRQADVGEYLREVGVILLRSSWILVAANSSVGRYFVYYIDTKQILFRDSSRRPKVI